MGPHSDSNVAGGIPALTGGFQDGPETRHAVDGRRPLDGLAYGILDGFVWPAAPAGVRRCLVRVPRCVDVRMIVDKRLGPSG